MIGPVLGGEHVELESQYSWKDPARLGHSPISETAGGRERKGWKEGWGKREGRRREGGKEDCSKRTQVIRAEGDSSSPAAQTFWGSTEQVLQLFMTIIHLLAIKLHLIKTLFLYLSMSIKI